MCDSPFDLDAEWRLHPQVAVRPEPFGALLYHFGTRKLSFLKDRTIVGVLRSLPEHGSPRAALRAAAVDDVDRDGRILGVDGDVVAAASASVAGSVGVAASRHRNGAKAIKTICCRELRRVMRSINHHKISQRAVSCCNVGQSEARHRTKKSERHDRVVVAVI